MFTVCCWLFVVAERVVKVPHPYLGPCVEVQLWSPLDDTEVLKTASHSAAVVTGATVKNDLADPVVFCVKKQSADPVVMTEFFNDCYRTDAGKSHNYLDQKASVYDHQSLIDVQTTAQTQCTPRQLASNATSVVSSSHCTSLSVEITADTKVQFCLLKQLLENGFAHEHDCRFILDESKWTVILTSKKKECISLLGEQLYEYKNSGTFEVGVDLSPGLSRALYHRHRQWLCDRLGSRVNGPTDVIMSSGSDSRLAVVAFSRKTAREGAEKLVACLLRGTIPVTDSQHSLVSSAKFRKQIDRIVVSRAIDVETGMREITVDGLPHDVVYAVSEIDRCLNK